MNKQSKGFTLIEVLIAAVILFMVIAATTLVYRSALLSSAKAEEVLAMTGYLPIIVENITEELKHQDDGTQSRLQGNGLTMQISYQWSATLLQAKSPVSTIDNFTGESINHPPRFRLWQVVLEMELGNSQKRYEYEDLTYPTI